MEPKDGDIILHCGHLESSDASTLTWHWFGVTPPVEWNGVWGRWVAACSACLEAGLHDPDAPPGHGCVLIRGATNYQAPHVSSAAVEGTPDERCAACGKPSTTLLGCRLCARTIAGCPEHPAEIAIAMQGHVLRCHSHLFADEALRPFAEDPTVMTKIEAAWRDDPEGFEVLMGRLRHLQPTTRGSNC